MAATSFLDKLEAKRLEYLESLAKVEDGDNYKHARIKGCMTGLAEAGNIFRKETKADQDEG